MALTHEQIQKLLALPARNTQRGRKPKGWIDTTKRDYQTWFKLAHKLYDESQPDKRAICSNPNCQDTRDNKLVAEVAGHLMCRTCFLSEYMLTVDLQTELEIPAEDK